MLKLEKTISIYSDNMINSKNSTYVEIHDIGYLGEKPFPFAGRALTELEAMSICTLFNSNTATKRHLLPVNVLLWHIDPMTKVYSCVFWVKSCVREITFQNMNPFSVPWPALVFSVNPSRITVFALKSNKRPEPNTELFHFPAWNRYADGSVCMGSGRMPVEAAPSEVVEAGLHFWFDTEFSHEGDDMYEDLDIPTFWGNLNNENRYPEKSFIKSNLVLEDLI